MKTEKVYRTTVTLEVYGVKSKREALTFLSDALHVDGLCLPREVREVDIQLVEPVPVPQKRKP